MFELSFKTDNAAFDGDYPEIEVVHILRRVSVAIESGDRAGTIYDSNGNWIGNFRLTKETEGD